MTPLNDHSSKDERAPVLDGPEPPPEGLGEFVETIIDPDGELEPELLESPRGEE